jgi:5,10-methylenetetrahydromethanopterin reductase
MRDYALECRGLLDGGEVIHRDGRAERPIRFAHTPDRYVDTTHRVPVYVGADGPKALAAAGQSGDGLIMTLQYANTMANAHDVFGGGLAAVREAASGAGRSFAEDAYTMWSIVGCVLEPGESPTSPRVLEHVGAAAMMAFHSYADNPHIAAYLPEPIRERIETYERKVLDRFDRGRLHQHHHNGHLSHLLEGEAEVLTDEVIRMTTLTGTAEEIADVLGRLEAAGLKNVTLWAPPHLTRETVLSFEERVMPLVGRAAAVAT